MHLSGNYYILAISELEQAVSQQKFASTRTDVWRLIHERRGDKLFIEKHFFQPAMLKEDNTIELVNDKTAPGVVDDIIDEIIEKQLLFGGEVVFMNDGSLDKFNRLGLKFRY